MLRSSPQRHQGWKYTLGNISALAAPSHQQAQAGPHSLPQGLLQCLVSVQLTLTWCLQLSAKPTCRHWPCKRALDRDTSKAKGVQLSCLSFPNALELPQEHFSPVHSAEKTQQTLLPHQWCPSHVQPCCPQPRGGSYLSAGAGGSRQPQGQDLAPCCILGTCCRDGLEQRDRLSPLWGSYRSWQGLLPAP